MAFEGTPITIPIKGIQRAGADTVIEDGAMNEVIGLEYKDGSFVPYSPEIKQLGIPFTNIDKILVHHTSFFDVIIVEHVGAVSWMKMSDYSAGSTSWNTISGITNARDIEFIGNVISIETKKEVVNFIFTGSTYKKESVDRSSLPIVDFMVEAGLPDDKTTDAVYLECYDKIGYYGDLEALAKLKNYDDDKIYSMLVKAKGLVQERGGLTGTFLVCYAWRLKNNSFIFASNPKIMMFPDVKAGTKIHTRAGNTNISYPYKMVSSSVVSTTREFDYYDDEILFADMRILAQDDSSYSTQSKEKTYARNTNYSGFTMHSKRDFQGGDGYAIYYDEDADFCKLFPVNRFFTGIIQTESVSSDTAERHRHVYRNSYQLSNILKYRITGDVPENNNIASLCIFISKEIDYYKDYNPEQDYSNFIKHEAGTFCTVTGTPKSNDDIISDIRDINNMYLVKEIKIEDIELSSWEKVDLKGKLGDNLIVRESLPVSSFNRSRYVGKLFTYNYRLHMFNYTQSNEGIMPIESFFYKGGNLQFAGDGTFSGSTPYEIDVKINSATNGESMIVYYGTCNSIPLYLNPMITYQGSDATELTIRIFGNDRTLYKTFNLSNHNDLNISYFINEGFRPIKIADDFEHDQEVYGIEDLPIVQSYNTKITYQNGIRVSETAYPNYFPLSQTDRVGNSEIIGMAKLTISLSQDTYGKYPILIFTKNGIYTINVNTSGAGAYLDKAPFSREVCTNRNTICEIDGAVVFASSKGLMIASEKGVDFFDEKINGEPTNKPKNNTEYGNGLKLYNDAITNDSIVSLSSMISEDDFVTFVNDEHSVVSYVSNKNKIIVYNSEYDYVYWIDITSRVATKLPISISLDNNDYPTETYYSEDTYMNFKYTSSEDSTSCMFCSRPIKMNSNLKGGLRVIVKGELYGSSSKWAELHIYGSLDGKCWTVVGAKEQKLNSNGTKDIGAQVDRVSFNYFMIMFCAELSKNSHIDSIEISNKKRIDNQLN